MILKMYSYILFVYIMCVSLCICQACIGGFRGQTAEEGTGSPGSGVTYIQVVMNHPLWVLRMKLRSSARAAEGLHS